MTAEIGTRQSFCEHVGGVVICVDVFNFDMTGVDKLAYFEKAALNVARTDAGTGIFDEGQR